MCPACVAMATVVVAGVASSGALSVFIAKTFRSRIEAQANVLKTGVQETNDHGNQRN
jgi:hypothetical protein